MTTICKNCNFKFNENYSYCPNCGQVKNLKRLSFHDVSHNIFHAFFHADKGIFLLFKELCYKPGRVARLYVEGKRKKYFDPFSFLVLMVAVAVFFILKFESLTIAHRNLNADNFQLLHFMFKYFNFFIFIMCPVNAFFIWLIFKNYKMNFIETLVLSAYVSGQTMFFYCIILIPLSLFQSFSGEIGIIAGSLLALWSAMAVLQLYNTKSFLNIVKAVSVIIILQMISQGLFYCSFFIYKKFV